MEHILLVEDDGAIRRTLCDFLRGQGFAVTAVEGQTSAERALEKRFDLALVDITLADGSGFAVCTQAGQKNIPVIFLTASTDELSTVTGLNLGADDYIAKPFRPRELVARIRSVLRRRHRQPSVCVLGDLIVDIDRGTVSRGGKPVFLSALEYRLLMVFVNNRGQILTRAQLLEEIWDSAGEYVTDNTLTVYIKRLREKIEVNPQEPQYIRTVRGLGYRMEA
ncbi:MAG: response regulator transcription factor [Lachnospiraceae bacterium]|nr:response regulator transcription factor [Lachnospiraceae bacterium]